MFGQKQVSDLNYPPYSPDFFPCDYILFPKLKLLLKGYLFEDIDDSKIIPPNEYSHPNESHACAVNTCENSHHAQFRCNLCQNLAVGHTDVRVLFLFACKNRVYEMLNIPACKSFSVIWIFLHMRPNRKELLILLAKCYHLCRTILQFDGCLSCPSEHKISEEWSRKRSELSQMSIAKKAAVCGHALCFLHWRID